MLQTRRTTITIRPKQPLQWLAVLGVLAIGVLLANRIYGGGAWVFALLYCAVSVGFLRDRIVFDGARLLRQGPGAWLLAQFGKPRELSLDTLEAISTYAGRGWRDDLKFQTVILGPQVGWSISSKQPAYQSFIKALFKAVNPHLLDPLSTELLLYWREAEPPFVASNTTTPRQYERWRRKAIRLSLDGLHDAAKSYFKIAHENAPDDPQIAYDIGRFLRRRALALGAMSERGKADNLRAETYFRMAGRLARAQQNARILERVGEAFFEFHQLEAAQKYFELAVRIDPVRPRANIGLAGIALQNAQGVRAVYSYVQAARGAEAAGATGLAQLAARKSEYYERLMNDDAFLSAETSWSAVLNQLKWVQRGTMGIFLLFWMVQLASFDFIASLRMLSREISATALILWICSLAASQIIMAYRRRT